MSIMGMCSICGRPAATSCALCGRLVCLQDSDPVTRICRVCSSGQKKIRTSN